jgi:hypothetical protein
MFKVIYDNALSRFDTEMKPTNVHKHVGLPFVINIVSTWNFLSSPEFSIKLYPYFVF